MRLKTVDDVFAAANTRFPGEAQQDRRRGFGWIEWISDYMHLPSNSGNDEFAAKAFVAGLTPAQAAEIYDEDYDRKLDEMFEGQS